jgi:hypothetical protein
MDAFVELWRAYPGREGSMQAWSSVSATGIEAGMHSAAAMNAALARTGTAGLAGQSGAAAETLAQSMRRQAAPGFGACHVLKSPNIRTFLDTAFANQGLVYAQDGVTHILDLWNGYRSTTRSIAEWAGWLDDAEKAGVAAEIWFWPVA